MSHHHPTSPEALETAATAAPDKTPRQYNQPNLSASEGEVKRGRGENVPVAYLDDFGFLSTDVTSSEAIAVGEHIKTIPVETVRHPFPFPVAHRKGMDKKTGKPIFERTIPLPPPNYQPDNRPMTTKELYDAAHRRGIDFTRWRFATIVRIIMMQRGYRLAMPS